MKKKTIWTSVFLLFAAFMVACSDNGETQAQQHLAKAQSALNTGEYNAAKLQNSLIL